MIRQTLAVAPVLAALALTGACSKDADAGLPKDLKPAEGPDLSAAEFEDATDLTEVGVQARDNAFLEPYLTVTVGTTVTFTNVGRTAHNVYTVDEGAFPPIGAGDLESDMTATITLDEPGDVPYYCTLHGTATKGMVGAFRVVE